MRKMLILAALAAATVAYAGGSGVAAAADQPWGFEQVTPPDKGGGAVSSELTFQTRADGNAFLYTTMLPFDSVPAAGAPIYLRYLATRTADGWRNRSPEVPYSTGEGHGTAVFHNGSVLGTSVDLSHALVASVHALTPGATEGGGNLYMEETSTGALTLVATSADPLLGTTSLGSEMTGKYIGDDGSLLFATAVPLVPGAPTTSNVLYGWTPSGGLRAESVLPASEGGAIVVGAAGNSSETGVRSSLPFSDGLAHVYFATVDYGVTSGGQPTSDPGALYVRSGGTTTVVSRSHIAGDPADPVPARADAIADGGRYVLFHTVGNTPLTSDTPTTSGATYLYRYSVEAAPNDALTYIAPLSGNNGVIQMTQNGQTIAFQTTQALGGEGVAGRQNMYVWRHGTLRFVETADAGSSASNVQNFVRVLSANGRYLAFSDNSASVAARFGFANTSAHCPTMVGTAGPCKEIYRFDADAATDGLACVSCRTDGEAPEGNAGDTPLAPGFVRLNGHEMQMVADDGTVFFTTPDDLLPQDSNGNRDVYALHDGQLRLVSRATQGTSARFLDATPDGRTVFFSTNDPIASTDTDRAVDIYMTREGAGFAYTPPVTPAPCVASECRAPFSAPDLPGVPTSVTFSGKGNVTGRAASTAGERVRVVGSRTIHGARGRLRVRVPAAGRLTVTSRAVRRASRSASKPGTYRISVRLTTRAARTLRVRRRHAAAAWRQLARAHRLTAKRRRALQRRARVRAVVTVRFASKAGESSAARVRVTFAAPLTKKGR